MKSSVLASLSLSFLLGATHHAPVGAVDLWKVRDLTNLSGATSWETPNCYVRGDGVTALVSGAFPYPGPVPLGHVHELNLRGKNWIDTDLSYSAGALGTRTIVGQTPRGHVRGDGVTAVYYLGSDDHIHETTLTVRGRF